MGNLPICSALKKVLPLLILLFLSTLSVAENLSRENLKYYTSRVDSVALVNGKEVLAIFQDLRSHAESTLGNEGQAFVYVALSKAYGHKKNKDSLNYWNRKAQEIYQKLDNKIGLTEVLYQEAYSHYLDGNYDLAIEKTLEGLRHMEVEQNEAGIALGYFRLSKFFHFKFKMPQSAEYGEKAGVLLEKIGDLVMAWNSWGYAGTGYRLMEGQYDKALAAYNRESKIAEQLNIQNISAMTYKDLMFFYGSYDQCDTAIYFGHKALQLIDPSDERATMIIHNGLGQNYLFVDNYEKSVRHNIEALKYVEKTNDIFFYSEIPEYLAKAYAGLNQYDSAYKYMKMNWAYSDSLFSQQQDAAIQEMTTKYETEKKELALAKQKRQKIMWLVFAGIMAIALFGLFYQYNTKNKLNAALSKKNQEKDLLLKEIHHRVKNNLELVKGLLALQSEQVTDDKVKKAMLESQNRVQSMGIIHQKLYQGENLVAIDMKDYFLNLGEGILDSFAANDQIKINCAMEKLELDVDTAVPIGLIVNELLTNSLKYAFPANEQGEIDIKMETDQENKLKLTVADNGIGKSDDVAPKGTGFGSQLVSLLTIQLNGKMNVETEQGTKVSFVFDLDKAA